MISRNGLSSEEIDELFKTATEKEKCALLAESHLLIGDTYHAVRQAEAYLMQYACGQDNLSPLDKKVNKLLMFAYNRDMLVHKLEARNRAEYIIKHIDDNSYEANLVYAESCFDDCNMEEAIRRANKFLTLQRDEETKHFPYLYGNPQQECSPHDWYYLRAKQVLAAAYKELGDVTHAQQHAEDAIAKYKILSCVPSQPLNIMAWVYSQQGKYAEALHCVETSWESYNEESISIAIKSFLEIGNVAKAVEWGEYVLKQKEFKNNREISTALLEAYNKQPFYYGAKAKELMASMDGELLSADDVKINQPCF